MGSPRVKRRQGSYTSSMALFTRDRKKTASTQIGVAISDPRHHNSGCTQNGRGTECPQFNHAIKFGAKGVDLLVAYVARTRGAEKA